MISVVIQASLALKDSAISANPNPLPIVGTFVTCPAGALAQDTVLAAASSNVALPFPVGVTTAAVLVIVAQTTADLIVKVSGQALTVPIGQPLFLYSVAASAVSVSSVLGGKITVVVGG